MLVNIDVFVQLLNENNVVFWLTSQHTIINFYLELFESCIHTPILPIVISQSHYLSVIISLSLSHCHISLSLSNTVALSQCPYLSTIISVALSQCPISVPLSLCNNLIISISLSPYLFISGIISVNPLYFSSTESLRR